jgi:hypothetical protein
VTETPDANEIRDLFGSKAEASVAPHPFGIMRKTGQHLNLVSAGGQSGREKGRIGGDPDRLGGIVDTHDGDTNPLPGHEFESSTRGTEDPLERWRDRLPLRPTVIGWSFTNLESQIAGGIP